MAKGTKFKTIKHYHEPGDLHELTFSCYHQMSLLVDDETCRLFARSVDRSLLRYAFELNAFVFMPTHVHMIVTPQLPEPPIDRFLMAMKRPFSYRMKMRLRQVNGQLLQRLTIRERPGVEVFRFWQEGPGYDRNLRSPSAIKGAIDYIHMNPVRWGLCERPEQWKWSSARFFHPNGPFHDPDLPTLSKLPWHCLDP